jgi:hypothetical protein
VNDQSRGTEPSGPRIEAALREYLERIDRGEAIDREEYLARHGPIADQLRSYIAAEDEVRKLAGAATPVDRAHDSKKSFVAHGQEALAPRSVAKPPVGPDRIGDSSGLSGICISVAPSGSAEARRLVMNNPQRAPDQLPKGIASTASISGPPEDVGSVIGPYKLLQKIGEGGFGVV